MGRDSVDELRQPEEARSPNGVSEITIPRTTQRPRGVRLRWLVALACLIFAPLVLWRLLSGHPAAKSVQPQAVEVAQATRGAMPVVLNELGTVTPLATVTVIPNQAVSGYLTDVPFKEGQDVEKGQLLAQIDPRPYQAALDQYQGQLARDQGLLGEAKMDLARYQKLANQNAIALQQAEDQVYVVQQDVGTVELDQAQVDNAKLNLTYCHITAPVAGRVGLRLVDPGNYVTGSSNTGIAVITTMKPTTVEFTVAQNDLAQVVDRFNSPGTKLTVTVFTSDNTKKLGTGTLYALSNQMATATGTVTLRAIFPNDDEALFPNEFVNVQLLVNTLTNAMLVPTPAVLTGAPGSYVYLVNVKNSTVSVHKVTPGPSDGKNTVIASGLNVGDEVVVGGTDGLSDGAKIKIAGSGAPAAPSPAGG